MTICRYFVQGNCRFGDICRFEHTEPYYKSNEYNSGRYDNSYQYRGRSYQAAPQPNYDQNRNARYNNDRFASNQQYLGSNYQESRYSYGDNYYQNNDSNHYSNTYDRDRHSWVSENYKRQTEQKAPRSGNGRFFDTSTPKSKTPFSFTDSNQKNARHQPGDLHMNEANFIDAEIIKEDALSWEYGNQWPFTCYCPTQGKSPFPGFKDLSPEELRLEAYNAKENNTFNSYVESVEKALQEIKLKREQLKEPSIDLMLIIEKMRKGETFISESSVDGIIPSSQLKPTQTTSLEDMVAEEAPFPQSTTSFFGSQTAASFNFKTALEGDTPAKSSASSFSFKTPSAAKADEQSVGGIYTPHHLISEKDKEQFLATTFTLGKIPTVPPPQEMCF